MDNYEVEQDLESKRFFQLPYKLGAMSTRVQDGWSDMVTIK